MGLLGMAPFKRDPSTGKFRVDWNAFLTLILSFSISTGLGGVSSYIAIRSKIVEHDFRIMRMEADLGAYIKTTNEHINGYSGDQKEVQNICKQLEDLRETIGDIRRDQIRRSKTN